MIYSISRKILFVTLSCLLFNSITIAYPVKLDNETLLQAKVDSDSVKKYDNDDVRQYSYRLGEKGYPFLNNTAPILIDIETPYSIAKYRYYKENAIYEDFTDSDKKLLIENGDKVKIVTRCIANATSFRLIPLPVKNVVIKKDGIIYKSMPAPITNYYSVERKWIFPIDIFNGSSDLEIIAIDTYDNAKTLKVKKEKLLDIK